MRTTAQAILGNHFHPDQVNYWNAINIDLAGAVLIDINAEGFRFRNADLRKATFLGATRLDGASFTGNIRCEGAIFAGDISLGRTSFSKKAIFDEACFLGNVTLDGGTTFEGPTSFVGATHRGKPFEPVSRRN